MHFSWSRNGARWAEKCQKNEILGQKVRHPTRIGATKSIINCYKWPQKQSKSTWKFWSWMTIYYTPDGVFQTWLYFVCLCLWWGLKSSLVVLLKKLQLQKKITFFWDLHENLLCNLTHTLNPEKMMTENCVYTYIYICPKRKMRCI